MRVNITLITYKNIVATAILICLSARSMAQMPFMVKDINTGFASSNPIDFIQVGDAVYFEATDGVRGYELWKAQGDSAFLVQDINVGSLSSNPRNFTTFNGALYFNADDGVHGFEPWKAIGDTAYMLKDISDLGGSNPAEFTVVGDDIFFSAADESHGRELWKIYNDSVYLVEDITPGSYRSNPKDFVVAEDAIYFTAQFSTNSGELYKAVGDTAFRVKGVPYKRFATPQQLTAFGSSLYFSGESSTSGREVWKAEGDTAFILKDIYSGTQGSDPIYFNVVDSVVYFSADDGIHGRELWKIVSDSVSLVLDINTGSPSASPIELTVAENVLYFTVTDGATKSLWVAGDGSPRKVSAPPGFNGATRSQITVYGNSIYFNAQGNQLGSELWLANEDSIILIKDILPGPSSSLPLDLEVVGDVLYFVADDGQAGDELWLALGNDAFLVKDIVVGSASSKPMNLIAVGDDLYFGANDGTNGQELWKLTAPLFSEINRSACGSYAFGGNIYTQSGRYFDTLTTAANRDSLVLLHLTITQVNTDISWDGSTFTAAGAGAYQWIDCENANVPILDSTNKTFTPESSGSYALIVSENGCTDTSACQEVLVTNSISQLTSKDIVIYPIPAMETVVIENKAGSTPGTVELLSLNGELVLTETVEGELGKIDVKHLVRGVYTLKITYQDKVGFFKLVLR